MTNRIMKLAPRLVVVFVVLVIICVTYVRIWELRQQTFQLSNVTVLRISPYRSGGGDLHWSFRGFRIHIAEDERNIDFPYKYWNKSIKIGDKVDITARKSYFFDELDGLAIEKVDKS